MSNLNMRITDEAVGVEMTIAWADEEEYQLGKKFLTDMGARTRPWYLGEWYREPTDVADDKPEHFYLATKQQFLALLEFRRSLREQRKT